MTDPEHVAARSVLLDALAALGPQLGSFVLVGAQAVYVHTDEVAGTGINRTTDADLALDTDLLGTDPELAGALEGAGFTPGSQPGSWIGARGVAVDIMAVPHQSNNDRKNARAANLPPHGKHLARITPGLEAALVDSAEERIQALDPADVRSRTIAVAGPAALLVAKAVKLEERHLAVQAGGRNRAVTKDAVDCFRLLTTTESEDLVAGFQRHREGAEAEAVSRRALAYLRDQHRRGSSDEVRAAIRAQLDDDVIDARYAALVEELLEGCSHAGLT